MSVGVALIFVGLARLISGAQARWVGCEPSTRQRIYFANHTSHLDFAVLWSALPREVRALTRPVAGRDYWERTALRRYLAVSVFHAVLVDRGGPPDRAPRLAAAQRTVALAAAALGTRHSLIIFPEGTRGSGEHVAPFKAGLYHLCLLRSDVELVPAWLENLNRVLPKGEILPVPVLGSVTFGPPLRLKPGEPKDEFLERTRRALLGLRRG
ncbi:1-acyl-sn-glycerol-3-phosphate acyltransferase [bacterium]|nr:1-acyl-sn-glycerol-3-phosphate acyltransferase [bacterium]